MPVPYDHSFKLLTDDDPRGAMAAFGGIPLDAEIEVQAVDRELNLATLRVDNLYRCRQADKEFVIHFEAVSRYRQEVLDRQVDYVRAIIAKHKLPCRSYLLLLTEGSVLERLPRFLEYRNGDYDSRIRLRAVRLWKIPARRILALNRPALLPWTALMFASPTEFVESWRRLIATGDRSLPDQMMLLRGLRYGNKEMFEEVLASMTMEEILKDSSVYQWLLEEGEKAGLEKGEKANAQRTLTQLLAAKFGPLPSWAEGRIAVADASTLNRWTLRVLTATSVEDCLIDAA